MPEPETQTISWKTLLVVALLSVAVGMFIMRPRPPAPVRPQPVVVDTSEVVQLRKRADSVAAVAATKQAQADSIAKARKKLATKLQHLEDSLRRVQSVRDSNVVLVTIVAEQKTVIASQAQEIGTLREVGHAQMIRLAALQENTMEAGRAYREALGQQQHTIDSLIKVKTKTPSECRILGIAKCPSRGTMFLAGVATTGILAVTINAVK